MAKVGKVCGNNRVPINLGLIALLVCILFGTKVLITLLGKALNVREACETVFRHYFLFRRTRKPHPKWSAVALTCFF